ncbi:MAG: FecR domain-containing protein [Burkholderiaceae bacterium]
MPHVKHFILLCALTVASLPAMAADQAGMVKISKGTVGIDRGTQKLTAPVGTRIFASDRIVTGADGSVGITLQDNTLLSAGPNSTVDLNKFAFNSTTNAGSIDASVKKGTLSVISGKIAKASPDAVSFSAPGMTLGVRGTSFLIDAGQ